jgi:hypothetical protein
LSENLQTTIKTIALNQGIKILSNLGDVPPKAAAKDTGNKKIYLKGKFKK